MTKEAKNKQELPDGLTTEQFDALKEKHGDKLKLIELFRENGQRAILFAVKRPERKIVSEYFKWMDKNFDKATDILVKNCCLSGVEQITSDDELFFGAGAKISELIPIARGEIKNS